MAYNVKFLKGSAEQYAALTQKDANAFYLVNGADLYLGAIKLSNGADLTAAVARIAENEADIIAINASLATLTGEATVEGSIKKSIADAIKPINDDLGNMDKVQTTNKTVAGAINELIAAIGAGGTAAAVTMEESTPEGYAKAYTFKQGETTIGTVNIPKDMVIKSGEVVSEGPGGEAGTYIKLTLANATEDEIYVNVGTLVDIYTVQANAAQIQLAMNGREISATIIDGAVGTTKIADNAIVTAKIADGNVTYAKLSTTVQASLNKADAAVAKDDYDTKIKTIEDNISANASDIATLEGKVDVEKVSTAISTAKAEAIADAKTETTNQVAAEKTRAEAAEKANADKIAALESAVGAGGSVESQINAKIADLDATVASETPETGKGIQVQVVEEAGKLTSVSVSGNYSNLYDAKGAASAAQTAAATDAQTKANTAEQNAKDYADGLAKNYDAKGAAAQALADAKAEIAKLDADITSAAVAEGEGIQVQVVEVDGKITTVAVTGNYDEKYDTKGAAETALSSAQTYADQAEADALAAAKTYANGLATNYDAAGSANSALVSAKSYTDTAETNAKAYTDNALTWGTIA